MALDVHVVSHTHWDREWYLPLGRFRQRLVALIDELLGLGASAPSFLLDGQSIVLEDYLAVRPERAGELAAALRGGRLEAGPWYVLADELIPSGEALVRNLLLGRRVLRGLRAEPPSVLYCPDSFGHPAALPLIARGFGAPVVIVWRGFGGRRWPHGDTARWRAFDGSEVVLHHLPRTGYEFGSNLPVDPQESARHWEAMRTELGPRARLGVVLVPNGADHHALQSRRDEAVRALTAAANPDRVVSSSLSAFGTELDVRARSADLPVVEGELRDSYGYTWTLQGTFGARAHEKRDNAHVERLLLRDAEPWSALAARSGAGSRTHLVASAWRALLQCHPHDTLCGCSIDEVAQAMETRLADARAQALGIRQDALLDLIGHDRVEARTRPEAWKPILLLCNPAARRRGGVAEVEIQVPLRHVPVGPGSGGVSAQLRHPRAIALDDGLMPIQVLSRTKVDRRVESPRHYPRNELVSLVQAVVWVPPLEGYGTRAVTIGSRRPPALVVDEPVVATETVLDNGRIRVEIGERGATLLDHVSGRRVERLLWFDDVGEAGDLYTHSPSGRPPPPPELLGARVLHAGPLRATIALRWRVPVAAGDARDRRRGRGRRGPLYVFTRLSLDAAAAVLRIGVRGENTAPDHRLRVRVGTDVRDGTVVADAAFGPVVRQPITVTAADSGIETPPTTGPLHRYVTVVAEDRGATLFSDGLAEYEAMTDGGIAVTLVRAVGSLSRNDIRERPGHAGWPTPTPGAQCLGPFAAELAVLLHGARNPPTIDLIERTADEVLLPLRGETVRAALSVPQPTPGIELEGEGLAVSAIKESEDGAWLVLRCANLLDRETAGRWRVSGAIREMRRARLDETPLDPLAPSPDGIEITVPPRGVVTVLVR
ncbi:MAG TPA: glycosyl hydrolase-related protein [Gemmatimonadaceae bacterium]|nr:glycosyl hydrolase-related protein [Gemmatimonadaceae bacterium]